MWYFTEMRQQSFQRIRAVAGQDTEATGGEGPFWSARGEALPRLLGRLEQAVLGELLEGLACIVHVLAQWWHRSDDLLQVRIQRAELPALRQRMGNLLLQ